MPYKYTYFLSETSELPIYLRRGILIEEGFVGVELNNKKGFIDKTGKEVVPNKYDDIWFYFFEEGFIGVSLNGKKGFVDIYGNEYFDF